jgi:hypothetical protein
LNSSWNVIFAGPVKLNKPILFQRMADKQRKDDSTCTVQGVGVGVGSYSSYESGVGSSGHEGGVGFRHESAVPSRGAGSSSGGGKVRTQKMGIHEIQT